MHVQHPPWPGSPPGQPPRAPHHLSPIPRPAPPGLTFDSSDIFVAAWVIIWAALALGSVWYAIARSHHAENQLQGMLAAIAFGVLFLVFALWWRFRIRRRKRVFTHGRVVQGFPLADVHFQLINRRGRVVGPFSAARVGFEDKFLAVGNGVFSPNPIVYVDGAWAGIYEPPRCVAGPWTPRLGG